MNEALRRPMGGVLAAIAITTAMDACGLTAFSALPLCPLMGLFWYLQRMTRPRMGFAWGGWSHYGLTVLYPVLVLGLTVLITVVAGAARIGSADWRKAGINLVLVGVSTILVAIVTEEGFFRGWLWASLDQAGQSPGRVLAWSSLAFSLWHVSPVVLKTGLDLPGPQIPVYLANAAVIGAIWGLMRSISGSVIVSSVSHGVWNGGAYVLFGFGTKVGALGVQETAVYGPEVGALGLLLNLLFAAGLWWWWKTRGVR